MSKRTRRRRPFATRDASTGATLLILWALLVAPFYVCYWLIAGPIKLVIWAVRQINEGDARHRARTGTLTYADLRNDAERAAWNQAYAAQLARQTR